MPDVSVSLTAGSSVSVTVDGSSGTTPTITNGGTANVTVSGAGAPGREIELRSSGGYIQWRYVGDSTWTNLLSFSSIVPTTVPSHATSHAAGGTDAVTIAISQVTGLQTALDAAQPSGSYVLTTDSRLSDAREWSAATVSQANAEAGTSTIRAAFTPLRVFQAVAAWWAGSSAQAKLDGIATGATANQTDAYLLNRTNHTGTQTSATISDFATAAAAAAPVQDVAGRTGSVTLAFSDLTSHPTTLAGYGITDAAPSSVSWSTLTGVPATFTPAAHAASHGASGSDAISIAASQVSGLATVATSGSAADLVGTLSASRLSTTSVTSGSYGSASSVGTFTVDATGRLTAAGSAPISIVSSQVTDLGSLATVTPTGTASSSTYLRGDATWATVPQPVGGTAEYASASAFPAPGVAGRLYVSAATNRLYRYSADDSVYVEVGTIQGTGTATAGRGHDLIPSLVLG